MSLFSRDDRRDEASTETDLLGKVAGPRMSAIMSSTALPMSFVLSVEHVGKGRSKGLVSVMMVFCSTLGGVGGTLPSTAGMGRRLNSDGMTGDLGSKYVGVLLWTLLGKRRDG